MGSHSDAGNSFVNYGLITVNGDTNLIDMGSGEDTLVPSLNPLPFENNGVIDFQDGAPDDMLTIYGDFAGEGTINVDADVDTETGDMLFIDGSVVDGTVQTINVDLANAEFEFFQIPLVAVSGDSEAGQFVLGDINFDPGGNGIVLVSLGIFADIDASNATNDVFYLGFSVDGIADAGSIGAALGGAAANMLRTNIGTWRQREGVIRAENDSAITLWGRVFTDKGDVEPEHVADNFGQLGNFNHELKVTGFEAGGDFNVSDEFHLGLMVATLNSDIRLHSPGNGEGDMDGTSWGIYGTWLPGNGFYADLSYRWLDFDASVDSGVIHDNKVDGSAEAFNIELGYAFKTAGGLEIEPQLQYTRINVDEFDSTLDGPDTTMELLGGDTTRTRFGVALRKSFESASGWIWTPHGTLSTVDESDSEMDFVVNGQWTGRTDTDGRSTMLELGLDAAKDGWAIFGGLNWSDGGAYDSFMGGQIGVRYTFGGETAAPPPPPPPPAPAKTCADLDDDGDGINNCDDKCLDSTPGQAVGPDGCPVPEPVQEPKPFRG
jgi:outer membrane autotransporter protein